VIAQAVFWGSALLLLHTYFFYPLVLLALDGAAHVWSALKFLRSGRERRRAEVATFLPTVSMVVAAYNEVDCIGEKLKNSLALDYPKDLFELLVGSDGSTDGTDEIVRQCTDGRVRLSVAPRGGKTSVLNRCIPSAKGDIIVLTDANTRIDEKAIARLVRHFRDPEVGAVCGKLKLFNPTNGEYEESAYWTYESALKFFEGKRGAVMGANGGLYAIRRTLFTQLPPSTIVDDFVIPMRILEQGYRVAYEAEAVAYEETTEDYEKEFSRRARIAAGNFQSLRWVPGLLSPRAGFPAFAFWSHKVLRWCAPALMALALVSNLFLLDRTVFQATFAAQAAFYVLAAASRRFRFHGALKRISSIAYYFVVMNLAMAVGFWRFLRNTQGAAWNRTPRLRPQPSA
jgi:cellulose synthase/poly-beta-1,6-N-acetylglucosamine synthase-like glycosyltransferase